MTTSRNDPCPCGSGKKFKKCHGAPERTQPSPESSRASLLKQRDVDLFDRLMRFARTRLGADWLQAVLDEYELLDEDGDLPDVESQIVFTWLVHHWRDDDDATVAQTWRASRPVARDDALLLDAHEAAWTSIWEVGDVQPGVGSQLTDVLTGEERFAHDVSSSRTLKRFDTLLATMVTCDGVSFFGGVHGQPLPPRLADEVVGEAQMLFGDENGGVSLRALQDPDAMPDLLDLWRGAVDTMRSQPPPALENTDGDPLLLTFDDFALLAPRDEIARLLLTVPGVHVSDSEDDDTVFAVTKEGNPVHASWETTIIGRVLLSDSRLRAETNSTRRADALRATLEAALPDSIRFRLRLEEDPARLIAEARAAGPRPPRPGEPMPQEVHAAVRQMREQHLRRWIDESIPALGGLTPRAAAASPDAHARSQLDVLLKEMAQGEARLPPEQQIDLAWLHEALGFPRL